MLIAQRQQSGTGRGQELRVGLYDVLARKRSEGFDAEAEMRGQPSHIGVFIDHAPSQQHLIRADAHFLGPCLRCFQQRRREDAPETIELQGRAGFRRQQAVIIAGGRNTENVRQVCEVRE